MSLEMGQIADLMLPTTRPFEAYDRDDAIMWSPYPRMNQASYVGKPALHRYVMTELGNLTEITVDMENLLFDKAFGIGAAELWSAAHEIYSRVRVCLGRLPGALRIDDQPLPQALFVR
jgi:hypothetical protein